MADLFGNAQILEGNSFDSEALFGEFEEATEKVDTSVKPEEPEDKNEPQVPEGEVDAEDLFGDNENPESVGDGKEENKEETKPTKFGSSPTGQNLYPSLAQALKGDGLFQFLDQETIDGVKDADGFREAMEKEVDARLDDTVRRVKEALDYGVQPSTIAKYERVINQLDGITDESIRDESERGAALRKSLITQDYINRGFSEEKAKKQAERSVAGLTDVEDAADALESLKGYFKGKYAEEIERGRQEAEDERAKVKAQAEELRQAILEKEKLFDEIPIDKPTRKKAYDAMTKIVKTTEDGEQLTAVQLYADEHPVEFRTVLGVIYALTDGFTKVGDILNSSVNKKVNKNLREMEEKLRGNIHQGGSFHLVEGEEPNKKPKFSGIRIDI